MLSHGAQPFIIPYCRLCEQPAERFTLAEALGDGNTLSVEAQCCGKTMGVFVRAADLLRMKRNNEKLWCIVRAGQQQAIERHGWVARRADV